MNITNPDLINRYTSVIKDFYICKPCIYPVVFKNMVATNSFKCRVLTVEIRS